MRMTPEEYKAWNAKKLAKVPKFRNKKKVVNGLEFDSTKEARRWQDLLLWKSSGQITQLERQKAFHITVNGEYIGFYVSDFYYINSDKQPVIEDVKSPGTRTHLYQWKKKLVKACFGIEIQEI